MKFQKKKSKKILATALAIGLTCSLVPLGAIEAFAIPPFQFVETLPGDGGGGGDYDMIAVHFNESKYYDELYDVTTYVTGQKTSLAYLYLRPRIVSEVSSRPSTSSSYTSMDTLYYMLGILQEYAEDWYDQQEGFSEEEEVTGDIDETEGDWAHEEAQTEEQKARTKKCNNLVLGYVRCINKNYDGTYGDLDFNVWSLIAGDVPSGFINYVNEQESAQSGLELKEYFASFLQGGSNDYNSNRYGTIDSTFLNKKFLLTDPLNSGKGIDLIHMFASMDGIYYFTERNSLMCNSIFDMRHDQDFVSWLGDLQTFTKEVNDIEENSLVVHTLQNYQLSLGMIDFNEFVKNGLPNNLRNLSPKTFPASDLLADVDAMNIAKLFINCAPNTVRDSMMGYYVAFWDDSSANGNRYYEFIYTCTRSTEIALTGDLKTDFRKEIYHSMNLSRSITGACSNYDYYDVTSPTDSLNLHYMKTGGGIPSLAVREYCTNLFYDFIVLRSQRF